MLNHGNNRFPLSAELFVLCKEILNIKHARGEKVTDQDVGSLLDFDPADCTHWKYGRKNIKSIHSLKQIAEKLGIDHRSLCDVIQGRFGSIDILNDYKGYGSFYVEKSMRHILKNEADSIISQCSLNSLPVFLPELFQSPQFFYVELKTCLAQEEGIEEEFQQDKHILKIQEEKRMCGSQRFLITQRVSKYYLLKNKDRLELGGDCLHELSNLFALFLLMPTHLIQLAGCHRDPVSDIVDQYSRHFWLSRCLVNERLKDFFVYKN